MSSEPRLVSILTPVFNEEESLQRYVEKATSFVKARTELNFEFILVDDGSSDSSWEMIESICADNPMFRGVRLSRNYGSHVAIAAAVDHAQGDLLMTLACDLQDPIETFDKFILEWSNGAHIVWGKRKERKDVWWRAKASSLFQWLLQRFAMPRGSRFTTGSFLLMDRVVAEYFKQFTEKNRVTFAIVAWMGFQQSQVEYSRALRLAGNSGWTFFKMLRAVTDALLSYSTLPLRGIVMLGILFFFFSLLILFYLFVSYLKGVLVPGWTSTVSIFSFFSGIQCFLIAILGEYLQRIYSETLSRPLYCIQKCTCKISARNNRSS